MYILQDDVFDFQTKMLVENTPKLAYYSMLTMDWITCVIRIQTFCEINKNNQLILENEVIYLIRKTQLKFLFT